MVYLDDIMIATVGIDEHFQILRKVFDRLVRNKLEVQVPADLCHLFGHWGG